MMVNENFIIGAIIFFVIKHFVVQFFMWREFVAIGHNPLPLKNGEIVPFYGGFIEGVTNVLIGGVIRLLIPSTQMIFTIVIIILAYIPWLFFEATPLLVAIEFIVITPVFSLSDCYAIRRRNIDLLENIK